MLRKTGENCPLERYNIVEDGALSIEESLNAMMAIMNCAFDENYGEAWNRRQLLSTMVLPGCHYSLVFDRNTPAAFSFSRRVDVEEELLLLAVHPTCQKAGLAYKTMKRFLLTARNNAVNRVFLEVRSSNPAKNLYQKLGFNEIGRRKDYYIGKAGQKFDAISMMLVL